MPINSFDDFVSNGVCGGLSDGVIDEDVKEEDALLGEPFIGRKPIDKKQGVSPLPMPKEMSPTQLREHMITHLPYCDGCPY